MQKRSVIANLTTMSRAVFLSGFIAAAGLASQSAQALEGLALAKASGCTACHSVPTKIVGPAWQDVANKYKGKTEITAVLTNGKEVKGAPLEVLQQKIAQGGKGNWTAVTGGVPMPANSPRVSAADVEKLAKFILSLS